MTWSSTSVTFLTGSSGETSGTGTETEVTPHGRAVSFDVAYTTTGIALLAISGSRSGAIGRLVAWLSAVVAKTTGSLTILGNVTEVTTFEATLTGSWNLGSTEHFQLDKLVWFCF